MSEPSTTATTDELDPGVPEPEPFLRIAATYPVDGDRIQTVDLSMYLGVDDDLGADDGDATRSWFISLCTAVIRELRAGTVPGGIVLDGAGRALLNGHGDGPGVR